VGYYAFADSDVALRGGIFYNHTDDAMGFRVLSEEAMRIDSSGNTHIGGTTSVTTAVTGDNVAPKLIVEGTTATSIAVLRQDTSIVSGNSLGSLGFYGTDTTSNTPTPLAGIQALASGTHAAGDNPTDLRFFTTPDGNSTMAEAMRIDSSGNLLVGTTNKNIRDSSTEEGMVYRNGLTLDINTSAAPVIIMNRVGNSDGDIALFRKDGATVGSIGSISGAVSYIVLDPRTNGSGIRGTTNGLLPANQTGAATNNHVDLGSDSNAFRNLYLSGGVYLGGTGSANKLDDYEEGTWTPTFAVGTNITYNSQSGTYTKIGRKVYVTGYMDVSNSDSDSSAIQIDLPFTGSSGSEAALFTLGRYFSFLGAKSTEVRACRFTGSRLVLQEDTGTNITYNEVASSGVFQFAAAYEVL
jgi:hypothetical protein